MGAKYEPDVSTVHNHANISFVEVLAIVMVSITYKLIANNAL